MSNLTKFLAVIAAFVAALTGVVWLTTTTERRDAAETFEELGSTDAILASVLERESALRGYAETRRPSFLVDYREASARLAAAFDDALADMAGDPDEVAAVVEQKRLADQWADGANSAIRRISDGRSIPNESALQQSHLISRLRTHHDVLRQTIDGESSTRNSRALQRAALLILLLTGAFALVGGLLWRRLRRLELHRQRQQASYHTTQREFSETLQVTENETEAHSLVKRHLERSVAGAEVVVLNRNNSQNRLEAATPVVDGSELARNLVDSSPRSCLAVRLGRAHVQGGDHEPLLGCDLCAGAVRSTCVPSLVGGEVIGSVLVQHERPLEPSERSRIDESVSQAAPVLANLRNLAVAEIRAATDALTGLPNARSLRDNLKRMAAQAERSRLPLAAVLCDLDHFKQINDVYGHDKGDQALAAASTAIRSALRESDLAGRYGGEEFLILLPDTTLEGAVLLAEKLRAEVALINVPGVDRAITASFGVAAFPQDAPDGDMLVRMADRALYAAKGRGRNCVVASADLVAENV